MKTFEGFGLKCENVSKIWETHHQLYSSLTAEEYLHIVTENVTSPINKPIMRQYAQHLMQITAK